MKRLFHNTVFSSIDAGTLIFLNLLTTPILISHFGVAQYGVFVFLTIFSTYGLLSFFDLGMEGSLLNYVARFDSSGDTEAIQDSLTVAVLYYGAIGLLLGLALYFGAEQITSHYIDDSGSLDRTEALRAARIIALNVVIQFLTLPFTAVLQGLRRFVITKSVNTILMIVQYLLVITVAVGYGRIDLAFAMILAVTALRLVTLILITRYGLPHFRPMRFRIKFSLLKTLFSYSSILLVSRIIGIVFNQMDKLLIYLYLAMAQMAVYDVVVRPANLVRMLITTINSAIIPEVARLHEKQEIGRIAELYCQLVKYAYLLMMPVLALFYIFMGDILTLWVGPELGQHSSLALIILSVYLLSPMAAVASTMAVGLEIVKKVLWISVAASVINICLSLVLLKYIGLAGLLSATLAAEIFMVFPYVRTMKKMLQMRITEVVRPILPGVLAALPFAAGYFLLRTNLPGTPQTWIPAAGLLLCIHYLVTYRFMLSREERQYLWSRLRGRKVTVSETADN